MNDFNGVIDTEVLRDANYINKELLEVQGSWTRQLYKKVLDDYRQNEKEKGKLSCAFSFGVSEHYAESDKRIMVVGQEANGHTCDYDKWYLEKWQSWAVDYLNFQVYGENIADRNFKTNPSAFWRFMRAVANEGYGVCWNNLDKVRRYKDSKEYKLKYKKDNQERELLNKKIFDSSSKSLIEKEIAIANPDMVIFVVGPNNPYYHTLYSTFLGEWGYESILNRKCPYPKVGSECIDVSEILNIKKAFYTYHPNYLSRNKKLDEVIAKIIKSK